jgi:tyrosinase
MGVPARGSATLPLLLQALEAQPPDRPSHERLGLTRRQFLKLCAIVAGAGTSGFSLTACPVDEAIVRLLEQIRNRPVRRDISALAPDDPVIKSYESAISAMQALPMSDPRNWTRQAQIHNDACRHRSWLFFPWHRAYLFYFERICRELSGDQGFALPYWNWTANPQIPAVFWDQSSPLYHANRVATQTSTASPGSVGQMVIDGIIAQANFLIFGGAATILNDPGQFGPGSGTMEQTPHNYIHGTFVRGTMGGFMSPLDPVFWTHHNRVEQLWVEWNVTQGNPNPNHSDWTGTQFTEFVDGDGSAVTVPISEMLLYPLLSYRFDTQVA